MFNKDLNDTFSRIQTRVKELDAQTAAEEEKERLEGLARLEAATQPDGTLALPVAENGEGARRAEVFAEFPRSFQGMSHGVKPHTMIEALLLQDVDKINEYLSSLSKELAEETVKLADEVGLLTLQMEDEESV
jgi:cell division cycle protein 37